MKNPFKPFGDGLSSGHTFQSIFKESIPYFAAMTMKDGNAASIILLAIAKMDIDNIAVVQGVELDKYLNISERTRKRAFKLIRFLNMARIKIDNRKGGIIKIQVNAKLVFGGNKKRILEDESLYKQELTHDGIDRESGRVNDKAFDSFTIKDQYIDDAFTGIPF